MKLTMNKLLTIVFLLQYFTTCGDLHLEAFRYLYINRLSVYNPVSSQCDNTPLITADNSRINPKSYNNNWIAVSRDLHVKYGGLLSFGDSIYIYGKEDKFKGLFIVRDLMNKRFKNSMDVCHLTDKLGLEINVKYQIINKKWKQ